MDPIFHQSFPFLVGWVGCSFLSGCPCSRFGGSGPRVQPSKPVGRGGISPGTLASCLGHQCPWCVKWMGSVSSYFHSEPLPPFSAPGDPATCKQITSADAVRNMEWATATCVLGFGVFGKFWNAEGPTKDRNSKEYPRLVVFTVSFYWLPPEWETHFLSTPVGSICVRGKGRMRRPLISLGDVMT